MNPHRPPLLPSPGRALAGLCLALSLGWPSLVGLPGVGRAQAATSLADSPLLATSQVPPNILMTLSVEWPTGVVAAYGDNASTVSGYECGGRDGGIGACYFPSRVYLGYFDPVKCYGYDSSNGYFVPRSASGGSTHDCSGTSSGRYSGNYLNWASTHALDGFRWTMTGGDRYLDTSSLTVIEKALHTGQGGNSQFPIKRVRSSDYTASSITTPGTLPAKVTPFSDTEVYARVQDGGYALGPGTTRSGRVVQFSNNSSFMNSFPSGGIRYVKVQLAGTDYLSLAEVQVLQNSSGAWSWCSAENAWCPVTGAAEVRYGANGVFTTPDVVAGGVTCSNGTFGDPLPGVGKHCEVRSLRNLATSGSARQSSTYGTGTPGLAIDGNLDGVFGNGSVTHTQADLQPWWQLDLGLARTDIRAIVLWNRTDCCDGRLSNVYVFGSNNDLSSTSPEALIGDSSIWMWQQSANPGSALVLAPYSGDSATPLLNGRVKVCDSGVGLESNCKAYGSSWKPTGVIQDNADQMRFGVLSYMNVDGAQTMGGVLRSPLKYVGPNTIVPNGTATTNARSEITSGGLLVADPESTVGSPSDVKSSGVINYINKFGKLGSKSSLKGTDTASEMFLEALRYLRGAPAALPQFSPAASWMGTDTASQAAARDGFPIYTNWSSTDGSGNSVLDKRPIQYACQKTYFVGIGDTNTWCDTWGPGDTHTGSACSNHDTGVQAFPTGGETGITSDIRASDLMTRIGSNEGNIGASLGTAWISSGRGDGYNISAYAWFANTHDLLPDDASKPWTLGAQHAQTYWVDVKESPSFNGVTAPKNQYWLAGRYSGYTSSTADDLPPANFDPLNKNYFTGERPDTLNTALRSVFSNILAKQQSAAPGTISSNNFSTASGGYLVQYNSQDWSGEVLGQSLSLGTDGSLVSAQQWALSDSLDSASADTRVIFTRNSSSGSGVPFRYALVPTDSTMTAGQLANFGSTALTQQSLINYLRGDRSYETTSTSTSPAYRVRNHLLGDIVNAPPVYVGAATESLSDEFNPGFSSFATSTAARTPMLYVGSNDGMLHAINATITSGNAPAGTEVWAFVPSAVLAGPSSPATPGTDGIGSRANQTLAHRYLVDGQAVARSVDFGNTAGGTGSPNWRTLLVGGLGKGGRAWHALDVTTPSGWTGTEASIASRVVRWEYTDSEMGYSYGLPVVAKTKKDGWVVILPSGHNSTTSAGAAATRSFIVVLNARTGALIQRIYTPAGIASEGLAQINAFTPDNSDFTIDSVYAGDLKGNVWRFDLTAASGNYANAPTRLATLTDASGRAQPVTAEINIGVYPDSLQRWVFAGTGQLLASADLGLSTGQSFYAIKDGYQTRFASTRVDSGAFPITRSLLTAVSYTDLVGGSSAARSSSSQGWRLDFNGSNADGATERMIFNSVINDGVVAFSTQIPSTDPCSPGISSRLYALDFVGAASHLVKGSSGNTTVAYDSNSTTILKPELVVGANGVIQMVVSTGNTSFAAGYKITSSGPGAPVPLNWREVLQ